MFDVFCKKYPKLLLNRKDRADVAIYYQHIQKKNEKSEILSR